MAANKTDFLGAREGIEYSTGFLDTVEDIDDAVYKSHATCLQAGACVGDVNGAPL